MYRLFENDERFLTTILIAVRSGKNPSESFNKNLLFFSRTHNVYGGPKATIELHKNFQIDLNPDIVVTSVPYDYLHKNFRISRLTKYLTIYAPYTINLTNLKFISINSHNNLLWRYYVESDYHLVLYNSWVNELEKSNIILNLMDTLVHIILGILMMSPNF